jgi:hypothetical protein
MLAHSILRELPSTFLGRMIGPIVPKEKKKGPASVIKDTRSRVFLASKASFPRNKGHESLTQIPDQCVSNGGMMHVPAIAVETGSDSHHSEGNTERNKAVASVTARLPPTCHVRLPSTTPDAQLECNERF